MKLYVTAFLIAGVVVPAFLHLVSADAMPWWPDTVSMGLMFGIVTVVLIYRTQIDREMNRRLWHAFKALGRHLRSR